MAEILKNLWEFWCMDVLDYLSVERIAKTTNNSNKLSRPNKLLLWATIVIIFDYQLSISIIFPQGVKWICDLEGKKQSMASSPGTDTEHRWWSVAGIVLNKVLMPYHRNIIQQEMKPFCRHLLENYGLDKQTWRLTQTHLKTIPPTTLKLNCESINHNAALGRDIHRFDYCVKDEVSLAKLFMKPLMARFNAFYSSFDASAALAVLCCAPPFSSAALSAKLVRSEVRNEWAHCVYQSWTEVKYNTSLTEWKPWLKTWDLPQQKKPRSWRTYSCEGSMVSCYYTYLKRYCFAFPSSRGGLNQNCILRPIECAGCWRDVDCNFNRDIHEPAKLKT